MLRKAGIVTWISCTGEQVEAVEHEDGWEKQSHTQFLGEAPSQRQIGRENHVLYLVSLV